MLTHIYPLMYRLLAFLSSLPLLSSLLAPPSPCYSPSLAWVSPPIHSTSSLANPNFHAVFASPPSELYIIGDIHGCFHEFQLLLTKIHKAKCADVPLKTFYQRVIIAGDLVNKGPFSLEVLDFCRSNSILAVRGNHDDSALAVFRGSKRTSPAYHWTSSLPPTTARWLSSLPYTISIPDHDLLIVHAGVIPDRKLAQHTPYEMTTMREVFKRPDGTYETIQHRSQQQQIPPDSTPWAKLYNGEHGFVCFGHDARRGLQKEKHAIGLDTGCVYGEILTAFVSPGKELIAVQANMAYSKKTG